MRRALDPCPRSGRLLPALLVLLAGLPMSATRGADDLGRRIGQAVSRGRESLMRRLRTLVQDPPPDFPMGKVAIAAAAALKSGASSRHPVIQEAFDKLREMPMERTYGVACYLFALDARWRVAHKASVSPSETGRAPVPRQARGEVRDAMVKAVNWLVMARAEGRGHWSYEPLKPGGRKHDFSNVQFAVLGLQIGLEHGIPIPRRVFMEIANCFMRAQRFDPEKRTVRITLSASLDDAVRRQGHPRSRSYNVSPGGWGYTAGRDAPYPSMTAAGASSLLVARNGLGEGRLRTAIDRALASAYCWIGKNFDQFKKHPKGPYYALYSLEKVGDLGDIEAFDGRDWYGDGAGFLIEKQRSNGSWGTYINTSLALLFLTRATRLKPFSPQIYTGTGRDDGNEAVDGYVYIDRVGGFISAREVLLFMSTTRRSDLVSLGEEVVRNYAPEARGDLAAPLLNLWTKKNDRMSRFARRALEEITEVRSSRREDFAAWVSEHQRIRRLESSPDVDADELARLLAKTESLVLRSRLLDVAHRKELHQLAGQLIGELSVPASGEGGRRYRRKVHGLLVLWTGRDAPPPRDEDDEGWQSAARGWSEWWKKHRERVAIRLRAAGMVREIEKLTRSGVVSRGGAVEKRVTRLVDALARLGEAAIPPIRDSMRRNEFSFRLIEAFERITGQSVGLRLPGD